MIDRDGSDGGFAGLVVSLLVQVLGRILVENCPLIVPLASGGLSRQLGQKWQNFT